MRYTVVNATTSGENELIAYSSVIDSLELQVEQMLEMGWRLQGGVSIDAMVYSYEDERGRLVTITRVMACQAMTRETNDSEEEGERFIWKE